MLAYVSVAFMKWQWNPCYWGQETRAAMMIGVVTLFYAFIFSRINPEDSK